MICTECGGDTRVLDSRPVESENRVKRRRECLVCGHRETSFEGYPQKVDLDDLYGTGAEDVIKGWFDLCSTQEELQALGVTICYATRRQQAAAYTRIEEGKGKEE